MNIPKEAIEKAWEGGWLEGINGNGMIDYAQIALDRTFWQALGKCLGWHDDIYAAMNAYAREDEDTRKQKLWLLTPHDFYELVLTSKPTDDFWAELLGKK